jgi:hypothetical protein
MTRFLKLGQHTAFARMAHNEIVKEKRKAGGELSPHLKPGKPHGAGVRFPTSPDPQ